MTTAAGHEVAFDAGWASLGPWGGIRVTGKAHFLIELSNAENIVIESTAEARLILGVWWLDEEGGRLIIIEKNGREARRVDLRTGEVIHLHTMQRYDDEGFRFLTIHELPNGGIAILTENELICMDPLGDIAWHKMHEDFTLSMSKISSRDIELRSQAPGRENHRRRFMLGSGDEAVAAE